MNSRKEQPTTVATSNESPQNEQFDLATTSRPSFSERTEPPNNLSPKDEQVDSKLPKAKLFEAMFVQETKMVNNPMVSQAHFPDKDDAMSELFFDTFSEFHDTIDEFFDA